MSEYAKFHRKPSPVDAFQWFGPNYDSPAIPGATVIGVGNDELGNSHFNLVIPLPGGFMYAQEGDWIVKLPDGWEVWEPVQFWKRYARVTE